MGRNGVIESIHRNAVLIDMSTISPSVTRVIAEQVEEKGGWMLDAPVSGGSWGAIEGTLSIMVGGQKSVFDRCLPVSKPWART